MKKSILILTVFFALLVGGEQASAAGGMPPGPPGGGGDPPCWPAPCVPIDGGISLLIAAGLAYGGKKAHSLIKSKRN